MVGSTNKYMWARVFCVLVLVLVLVKSVRMADQPFILPHRRRL